MFLHAKSTDMQGITGLKTIHDRSWLMAGPVSSDLCLDNQSSKAKKKRTRSENGIILTLTWQKPARRLCPLPSINSQSPKTPQTSLHNRPPSSLAPAHQFSPSLSLSRLLLWQPDGYLPRSPPPLRGRPADPPVSGILSQRMVIWDAAEAWIFGLSTNKEWKKKKERIPSPLCRQCFHPKIRLYHAIAKSIIALTLTGHGAQQMDSREFSTVNVCFTAPKTRRGKRS